MNERKPFKSTLPARRTGHGYRYQAKFLMLFALRGKRYRSFNLATEMNLAKDFDDVVFESEDFQGNERAWHFLQVKHNTTNGNLQLEDLDSTYNKAEFSLSKYFVAYCNIKKEDLFNDPRSSHKFAIVTNRSSDLNKKDVKVDNTDCSIEVDTLDEDDILYFESGHNKPFAAKKYRLKHKISSSRELFTSFLDQFYFVTDYPNTAELRELIDNEFSKFLKNRFDERIISEKKLYVLNRTFELEMMDFITNKTPDNTYKYYTPTNLDDFIDKANFQ